MARITAVINQKGGVGKTTTVHALASGLLALGRQTLVIDMDPQCNISYCMGAASEGGGAFELLSGEDAKGLVQGTEQGMLIKGSGRLVGADKIFVDFGMEYLLSEALEGLKGHFQHIVIDCPPQLGVLTINALVAADDIVVPMTADIFAMQGLVQLFESVAKIKARPNPTLRIDGILLTRHSVRSILSRDLKEAVIEVVAANKTRVYNTVIREGVAVREAQAQRMSIFEYARYSKGAMDYWGFIGEFLKEWEV